MNGQGQVLPGQPSPPEQVARGALCRWMRGWALDWRSLALFRAGLSLMLLVDLGRRWQYKEAFFGSEGILDFETWTRVFGGQSYAWTWHTSTGIGFDALMAVHLVLLVCVLVGYRVRLAALGAWILLVSLMWRNPLLMYGGDKLAPLLLLGLVCAHRSRPGGSDEIGARDILGGLFLRSQVVITYAAAGASKLGETSWASGEALGHVFQMNQLVKPFGVWLSQFEGVLQVASRTTPWLEALLPWLLLAPAAAVWGRALNWIAITALLGLNLGILLTLCVGYFMFYAGVALLALMPSNAWNTRLGARGEATLQWMNRLAAGRDGLCVRTLAACLAIFLLAVSWVTALEGMKLYSIKWSRAAWNVVRAPQLYQNWGLFTNPTATSQWYVAQADLRNGSVVDLFQHGAPVDFRGQRLPNATFKRNFRWRLALAKAVHYWGVEEVRHGVARGVATSWNRKRPAHEQVELLTIYRLTSSTGREDSALSRVFGEWPLAPKPDVIPIRRSPRLVSEPDSDSSEVGEEALEPRRQ